MARSPAARRERMHLRLNTATKRTLERAAAFEATSVSEYVLATATAAAEEVIARHRTVTLAPPDWDAFFAALTRPPAPNAALRKAIRRFRSGQGARSLSH
jgi:uncharacterized protein (DUF1778 family)